MIVGIGILEIKLITAVYNEEMYKISANITKSMLSGLNGILDSLNVFGDYFVGDNIIQTHLITIKDSDDLIEISSAKRALVKHLHSLQGTVPFLKDIALVVPDQGTMHSGDGFSLFAQRITGGNDSAIASKGKAIWLADDKDNVYYVRQVRRKEFLKLDHLAFVYLKLHIPSVLADIRKNFNLDTDFKLSIYQDNNLLYSSFHDEMGQEKAIPKVRDENKKYSFTKIDGNKYFVIGGVLSASGWEYANYFDYQDLSNSIFSIVLYSVLVLLLAMLLSFVFVHLIIKHIIHHLNVLENKMTFFESGNLDESIFPSYSQRSDEIGSVHQHFDNMVIKFNSLIKDNYVKQLMIKDNTIKMLSQQINPHFLYNVLDSIYWLAQGYGATDIEQMSYSLANLFRISITDDDACVSLSHELEFLNSYLKIQTIRFTDRLSVEINIPNNLLTIPVPKFSIQPLVENAIKHSMELNDERCAIIVSAEEIGDLVLIKISNSGSAFEDDILQKVHSRQIMQSGSIGLLNIQERLELLFGKEFSLSFQNLNGMACVSFCVPKG
nr:histidine kinase [uncultured Sphaerochaeta sp.]